MSEKVEVKPTLICIDSRDEYELKWTGRIIDANPAFDEKGQLNFIIISSQSRVEVNTLDLSYLEKIAKKLTYPKGRGAVSTDKAYIFVRSVDGKQYPLGTFTHQKLRTFAPVYGKQKKNRLGG